MSRLTGKISEIMEVAVSRKKRKKRKLAGHYCWACDRRRANEKFSGRGHARHLCRDCAKLGAEELAHRQALRNLQRCVNWEGRIPRKQRKSFEQFLHNDDPRIRDLAKKMLEEDRTMRRLMRAETELDEPWGETADEIGLMEIPFHILIEKNAELRKLRAEYADLPVEQRREAAEWAHDSAYAAMLMAQAVNELDQVHQTWHDTVAPLAIDPEYAPAMLTVGSLEYQYGRVEEAMALFLKLTTLPTDTEDLTEIIDMAGDFLLHQDDHVNAGKLYVAATCAYPEVALYHVGRGYCAAKSGRMEESVTHHRRAVKLDPNNYIHLNDLGYSLLEAGHYDEAEGVLQRAVQLAPSEYDLAKGNLEHLHKLQSEHP